MLHLQIFYLQKIKAIPRILPNIFKSSFSVTPVIVPSQL